MSVYRVVRLENERKSMRDAITLFTRRKKWCLRFSCARKLSFLINEKKSHVTRIAIADLRNCCDYCNSHNPDFSRKQKKNERKPKPVKKRGKSKERGLTNTNPRTQSATSVLQPPRKLPTPKESKK